MSNVASLPKCRELYELSGWEATAKYRKSGFLVTWGYIRLMKGETPAYDAGYLLRKLPRVELRERSLSWTAWCNIPANFPPLVADTPEDALCKLAIELIKQGLLPPNTEDE